MQQRILHIMVDGICNPDLYSPENNLLTRNGKPLTWLEKSRQEGTKLWLITENGEGKVDEIGIWPIKKLSPLEQLLLRLAHLQYYRNRWSGFAVAEGLS